MYGIGGERGSTRRRSTTSPATRARSPVRIGNGACNQHQHDVWGAMLDSIYLHTKSRDQLAERVWPMVVRQVEKAIEHWREPDRGIWEVRGEPQHFTSSKVMCWVALRPRRAARAAARATQARRDAGARPPTRSTPTSARNARRRARRVHPALRHDGARRVAAADAAAALPAADDERIRKTVLAIADELTVTASCCATASRRPTTACPARRARSRSARSGWCRRWSRSASTSARATLCEQAAVVRVSPLQLYAEEIDPHSGRHLGNFPQAFTHLALINAVMHVIRADEELAQADVPLSASAIDDFRVERHR